MDVSSQDFLSALAAIVIIDLVLAGDNAIVIALAARRLPKQLQKKAIAWGTVGAIAVRAAMTLVVVALLKIPGLQAAGGLLLIWIAYKLCDGRRARRRRCAEGTGDGFQPIRTIVIADTVMGLDNVLGVAGAAQGSFAGRARSAHQHSPYGVGSTRSLSWTDPVIIYLGSGVLAWTAAKMLIEEPLLKVDGDAPRASGSSTLSSSGVLAAGFLRNRTGRADPRTEQRGR
jgi:YjbE family integral membrane protein